MSQEILLPCEECGHEGTVRLGQTVVGNQLRWYRSVSCPSCGHIEVDGVGIPPEHMRDQLLQKGGRWNLLVTEANKKARAIRVIRNALGLSMEETAARLRVFPIVYTGTKTEVEWLKGEMEASNVISQIIECVEL